MIRIFHIISIKGRVVINQGFARLPLSSPSGFRVYRLQG